jgi:hypothetical protein
MMMSPLFRGETSDSNDAQRMAALDTLGIGRLLSPEQLHRKLLATTGFNWKETWQEDGKLQEAYYMFYGGIDSDGITKRPDALNSLMYSVVERMANELSCEVVVQEFWPGMERALFTEVDIDTDPTTPEGEAAIRATINNLMWRLWGVSDSAEQEALWGLYKAIYDQRIDWGDAAHDFLDSNQADDAVDEFCRVTDYDDADGIDIVLNWDAIDWGDSNSIRANLGSFYNPEQTLRPWVSVLKVMLTDIQFITE